MSLAIILGGWVLATGVVGVFAWSLGRAAAIGDRQDYELVETGASVSDRRVGSPNRRDEARPWLTGSLGPRSEDVMPRDVGERALDETVAVLTPAESERRGAD